MNAKKPDLDRDPEHANDNGHAVAAVPTGGALTSLQALGATLNKVDVSSISGRSGLPMLQFTREGDGRWSFGQRRTVVENDSRRRAADELTAIVERELSGAATMSRP